MLRDGCPRCGHRRERTLLMSNPDAPGILGLLRGEGDDPLLRLVAKMGVMTIAVFVLVGVLMLFQLHL